MLEFFRSDLGLTRDSVFADIGSGTGLSAKPFLENGNVVYGVEPNAGMRTAAESLLKEFANFRSIDGTADKTSLPDQSMDFVVAAQAFHWFEPDSTRIEFKRF
jgi:ubiquinone/menaquinone biosynthesis C-methylase UbiE